MTAQRDKCYIDIVLNSTGIDIFGTVIIVKLCQAHAPKFEISILASVRWRKKVLLFLFKLLFIWLDLVLVDVTLIR